MRKTYFLAGPDQAPPGPFRPHSGPVLALGLVIFCVVNSVFFNVTSKHHFFSRPHAGPIFLARPHFGPIPALFLKWRRPCSHLWWALNTALNTVKNVLWPERSQINEVLGNTNYHQWFFFQKITLFSSVFFFKYSGKMCYGVRNLSHKLW